MSAFSDYTGISEIISDLYLVIQPNCTIIHFLANEVGII